MIYDFRLTIYDYSEHLNLFTTLRERPSSPAELAQTMNLQERGARHLLEALAAIGCLVEKSGRYHNTPRRFVRA